MAQSLPRSQLRTPKHLQGTLDDPSKTFVLYEGTRSSNGSGRTLLPEDRPNLERRRLELSIRNHYSEDKTMTDL